MESLENGACEVNSASLTVLSTVAVLSARVVGSSALFLLLLSGCAVVPVGSVSEAPYRGIPDSVIREIQPGTTTRSDILLQLSEPWIQGPSDGYFVYSWLQVRRRQSLFVVVPLDFGVAPFVEGLECHCLVVQFGDDGSVRRVTTFSETSTARDMSRYPCPGEQMQDQIFYWLAQAPASP